MNNHTRPMDHNFLKTIEQLAKFNQAIRPSFLKYAEQSLALTNAISPSLLRFAERPADIASTIRPSFLKVAEQSLALTNAISPSLLRLTEQSAAITSAISPSFLKVAEQSLALTNIMRPYLLGIGEQSAAITKIINPVLLSSNNQLISLSKIITPSTFGITDELAFVHSLKESSEPIISDKLFKEIKEASISETNEGYKVNGDIVENDEIISTLRGISEDIKSNKTSLNSLLAEIEKSTTIRGNLKLIVINVILTFLTSLSLMIFSGQFSPKADLKQLQRQAHQIEISEFENTHLKYVYVKTILHVRNSNYIHADIIDALEPGTTVIVIAKSKSWTFVKYKTYHSDYYQEGWVFTRYLRKFRP